MKNLIRWLDERFGHRSLTVRQLRRRFIGFAPVGVKGSEQWCSDAAGADVSAPAFTVSASLTSGGIRAPRFSAANRATNSAAKSPICTNGTGTSSIKGE